MFMVNLLQTTFQLDKEIFFMLNNTNPHIKVHLPKELLTAKVSHILKMEDIILVILLMVMLMAKAYIFTRMAQFIKAISLTLYLKALAH